MGRVGVGIFGHSGTVWDWDLWAQWDGLGLRIFGHSGMGWDGLGIFGHGGMDLG